MADRTIADRQDEFQQWYGEWLNTDAERTPESLLAYFKARLCVAFGVAA
jgi:hypothetical protein